MTASALLVAFLAPALMATVAEAASGTGDCQPFKEIYENGEDLCNTIFSDSFQYIPTGSPDHELAYHFWFFDEDNNPNEDVTEARIASGNHTNFDQYNTSTCLLEEYNHKPFPTPEADTFTECHPWKQNSCCNEATVETPETINALYGDEWRWDRCGKLSPACERFFVQEACFYECEPAAGLFRKYPPWLPNPENGWQLEKLPIKGEYCDAWFNACREDFFCALGGGDFFECAKLPPTPAPTEAPPTVAPEPVVELSTGGKVAIGATSMAAVMAFGYSMFLIKRERAGAPVFATAAESMPITASA